MPPRLSPMHANRHGPQGSRTALPTGLQSPPALDPLARISNQTATLLQASKAEPIASSLAPHNPFSYMFAYQSIPDKVWCQMHIRPPPAPDTQQAVSLAAPHVKCPYVARPACYTAQSPPQCWLFSLPSVALVVQI
ncbi:uncharacterized protein CANTADRAFT_297433 [Suhomyces tanzawaensis NRRL Y-17324]|uniref:Uncharacterized protein n=1 Tax=Suhomyces tanzawaensis NRRL Y-17324 TaxID=984487 RepID=A0A1E4SF01_9ASCO|nr:uncharacterized protein CANTADRAFT_297433 [Suhomyces tanzawaensis NRRL Y-17324]ODV78109.1 hypothetical protein CANTADRAFT_297433 [Suhomyces tanzawaensis NRRL Y-17324]